MNKTEMFKQEFREFFKETKINLSEKPKETKENYQKLLFSLGILWESDKIKSAYFRDKDFYYVFSLKIFYSETYHTYSKHSFKEITIRDIQNKITELLHKYIPVGRRHIDYRNGEWATFVNDISQELILPHEGAISLEELDAHPFAKTIIKNGRDSPLTSRNDAHTYLCWDRVSWWYAITTKKPIIKLNSLINKPLNLQEHDNKNETIKVTEIIPAITIGKRFTGQAISGRTGRVTTQIGHLSNAEISC